MLDDARIRGIVRESTRLHLKPATVSDVITEPTVNSQGEDALRITIVIGPGDAERLSGDAVIDTLVSIQDRLREAGEERFPIIQYATKEELEAVGDTEP